MKCPKCKKSISFAKMAKEWEDSYGEDCESPEFMVMWACEHCHEQIAGVFVDPVAGFEEMDMPEDGDFPGGTVRIPKFKED